MTAPANYDHVVEQLRAGGLDVQALEPDRLVRCRLIGERSSDRPGWYCVHGLQMSGGDYLLVGAWGNWREGVDGSGRPISHRIELPGRGKDLTREEREAIRARVAEDKRRAEAARKGQQARAARRAERAWRQFSETGECAYLAAKGIQAHGARFTARGNLVLPMIDGYGKIHGLQVIYGDPEVRRRKGRDKDFWPKGLAKRGYYFLIGSPTWVVLIAEGFATGASLHEATGLPVAVAFDAGNLMPVTQALVKRYREAYPLICGDDDFLQRCAACGKRTTVADPECAQCGKPHRKQNTGLHAAQTAALAVGGSWVAPQFSDRGDKKLTDFNDLHQAEGLHVVRAQIEDRLKALDVRSDGAARAGNNAGEAGQDLSRFSVDRLLSEYALIYGTETVFDRQRRRIIGLSALRAAGGKSTVRMWLEHPERRTVLPEQVVFDPQAGDGDGLCNLYGGWPTSARPGACELHLELLEHLCSIEDKPREVYNWILKWLAYPVQNPGAKMQTALLVHGPEGSGKNTFFAAVREIYDKYGGIFTQTELESQFNGWTSGKLFMIGNEVVSRVELYHQQGRLKNLITEPEIQINEKNLPVRLEANHCNFVFFSNRIDIAKLDRDDRRYCVVWTPAPLSDEFYIELAQERAAGGVAALHEYLLGLDLEGFSPHAKPPFTRSKRELIELSMDSTERFWRDWTAGELPVKYALCRSEDLYEAYRYWAGQQGLPRAAPANVFNAMAAKKNTVERCRVLHYKGQAKAQSSVIWPNGEQPPPGQTQSDWATECIVAFRHQLDDWKEGNI